MTRLVSRPNLVVSDPNDLERGSISADVLAGAGVGPSAVEAQIEPGIVFADNPLTRREPIAIDAALTADYTLAADQAGDGTGGNVAFGAPADGDFLALHVMGGETVAAALVFTNVAAIPEDSVPDFPAGYSHSKIVALLMVRDDGAAAQELMPSMAITISGDVRRTMYFDPAGVFTAAVGAPQVVLAAASGDNVIAGVPVSNVRRAVVLSVEFDPAEGAMAVGDSVSLANGGSTIPVVRVEAVVAADANHGRVTAEVFTTATGQTVGVLIVNADAAHVRVASFDTSLAH